MGSGKTRLALECATRSGETFADGVFFVTLAPLLAPAFMVQAIASALGFAFHAASEPKQQLLRYLREKALLLVLDNFEHLLAPSAPEDGLPSSWSSAMRPTPEVVGHLARAAECQSEWVFELQGLALPPVPATAVTEALAVDVQQSERYSAVALFVQRARQIHSSFTLSAQNQAAVTRICHLVNGMPLGIELAAAWVPALSCQEIAHEIARSVDFLVVTRRDVPARHRSLRAVFDHSWQLLSHQEQAALRQLAVFRGGFTRQAAENVAGATLGLLSALVTRSLLSHRGEGRYDLHELIRQYSGERLEEAGEGALLYERHLAFFLQLAEEAEPQLDGPQLFHWFERLEQEHDNLRSALTWALGHTVERALRLLNALAFYWRHGRAREGGDWLTKALQMAAASAQPVSAGIRAKALMNAALLEQNYEKSFALARASLVLARQIGDKRSMAFALIPLAREAGAAVSTRKPPPIMPRVVPALRRWRIKEGWPPCLRRWGCGTVFRPLSAGG